MVTNLIRSTATKVGNNFKSQLNELKDSVLPGKLSELGDGFFVDNPAGNRIIFPLSMRNETAASRPMISFTIEFERDRAPSTIYFPCPGNIAFADNGNYKTIGLGAIGAYASDVFDVLEAGATGGFSGAAAAVKDKFNKKGGTSGLPDAILEGFMTAGSSFGAVGGVDLGAGLASFASQKVVNPRENVTFENNSIRQFSFNFKLIASSAQEYKVIDAIHTLFQAAIYAQPIENTNLLRFPPTSEIKFLFKGRENPNIPKIHKTYLTGMTSTYNSTANSWRTNGEPLEVDFALTFQECRVLTRDDIEELLKENPDRNKGDRAKLEELGGRITKALGIAKESETIKANALQAKADAGTIEAPPNIDNLS